MCTLTLVAYKYININITMTQYDFYLLCLMLSHFLTPCMVMFRNYWKKGTIFSIFRKIITYCIVEQASSKVIFVVQQYFNIREGSSRIFQSGGSNFIVHYQLSAWGTLKILTIKIMCNSFPAFWEYKCDIFTNIYEPITFFRIFFYLIGH